MVSLCVAFELGKGSRFRAANRVSEDASFLQETSHLSFASAPPSGAGIAIVLALVLWIASKP